MSPRLTSEPISNVEQLLDRLLLLADKAGERPGLSELDHGLQCAAELRLAAPDDVELQVAGLIHDLGHGLCSISIHAEFGADLVRPVMGERIANLIALHAAAKRYMVTTDKEYLSQLSPVSRKSLELQGGLMSPSEVAAFEANPDCDSAVLLRKADDAAKTPGRLVPGLDVWIEPLRAAAL
jgi:predicted HD phosphohydrolase